MYQIAISTFFISGNFPFMNSPLRDSVASPILDYLSDLHREVAKIRDGSVATYLADGRALEILIL